MLWKLMCLLLGLPLTAMATVEQQGSVGDDHVIYCRRHDVLGVNRPRLSVLHQRVCIQSKTALEVYFFPPKPPVCLFQCSHWGPELLAACLSKAEEAESLLAD